MAVVNTKSSTVSAFDSIPRQPVDSYKHAGYLRISKDSAEVAVADDDLSVYRMCRIPSNASIKELNILNDAIAGATDYDLGVYQTQQNDGAVVDKDIFASAIDLTGARTLPLNALFEAGIDIVDGDTRLWELLGLSEDPHRDYDICYTGNTVGTAAGSVALECVWSQ